jgi:hypothetical protein
MDRLNDQDLEFVRSWFERPGMGWFPIRGLDRKAWDPEFEDDLIALKARTPRSAISVVYTDCVPPVSSLHRGEGESKSEAEESLPNFTNICSGPRVRRARRGNLQLPRANVDTSRRHGRHSCCVTPSAPIDRGALHPRE